TVPFGGAGCLRQGDIFGVFFTVLGALAPIEYRPGPDASPRVVIRPPLSGALRKRADDPSLVVFILFMLSSTTYDAIHETYLWIGWYWQRLLPLLQPLWGTDVISAQTTLTTGYWWYQWMGLVASPLFYLALYLVVLSIAVRLTRAGVPLHVLSGLFV